MFAMHDTSLEWTVFLDSFCLLQNYWTWKWCNDDNKMSFFSTIHIYLSLFHWYVVIFVLTLFLRVGWIVSLHHATYSRYGGSIPVDHLLPPCFFSFSSPHPSIFPFPFHSQFCLTPAHGFLSHLIRPHQSLFCPFNFIPFYFPLFFFPFPLHPFPFPIWFLFAIHY